MPPGHTRPSTGIIVLGMHRSGTSLAAEIAHRWGAYVDTDSFDEPNDGNPRGYWEHRPLVELNDELLAMVHSSWKVPPTDEGRMHLARLARGGRLRRRALMLLATMNPTQTVWLWKDPRLCLLLPFWKQIWDSVVYVVTVRDPMAISSSLCARGDFSTPAAILLWQRYMSNVICDEDVSSRALFISYEELVGDSPRMCDRICAFLDENTGRGHPDREHRLAPMVETVQPQLHRHKSPASFSANEGIEVQRELYRVLMLHTRGEKAHALHAFPMPAGWRDVLVRNAIAGNARETFHGMRRLLRPAKWKARTFLRRITNRWTTPKLLRKAHTMWRKGF